MWFVHRTESARKLFIHLHPFFIWICTMYERNQYMVKCIERKWDEKRWKIPIHLHNINYTISFDIDNNTDAQIYERSFSHFVNVLADVPLRFFFSFISFVEYVREQCEHHWMSVDSFTHIQIYIHNSLPFGSVFHFSRLFSFFFLLFVGVQHSTYSTALTYKALLFLWIGKL